MLIIYKLHKRLYRALSYIYWSRKLKNFGKGSFIDRPLHVDGVNISIGNKVFIQYKSWIAAMPITNCENPILQIEDGSVIGHFNEIYSTKKIIIQKNVLTADRVYISDNLHGYKDITRPVIKQEIIQNGEGVVIGEGSWIGVGVAIIGASVGKHCIIGANSVVTHDIPDYCVAAGAPAKIIKRYNLKTQTWEKYSIDYE